MKPIFRILYAVSAFLTAGALLWMPWDILRTEQAYSISSIATHWERIWIFPTLFGLLTCASVFFPREIPDPVDSAGATDQRIPQKHGNIRFLLIAVALVLIVLGIRNGGMQDVFIKAVNICTECIGLG